MCICNFTGNALVPGYFFPYLGVCGFKDFCLFCLILKNLVVRERLKEWLCGKLVKINSKSEARNSKQSLMTKILNIRKKTVNIYRQILILCFGHLNIRNSNLSFDFRNSTCPPKPTGAAEQGEFALMIGRVFRSACCFRHGRRVFGFK